MDLERQFNLAISGDVLAFAPRPEFDDLSVGQREKPDVFEAQFAFFLEVFREMFNLLEEHAPTRYTKEHGAQFE